MCRLLGTANWLLVVLVNLLIYEGEHGFHFLILVPEPGELDH